MTDNQIQLFNNLVNQFATQIPAPELSLLNREINIEKVKEAAPQVYNKILQTINGQGIAPHLLTAELDREEYWAEFLLEMIWTKEKQNNPELDTQTRYSYWKEWKVQRINLKLENKKYE